ncbi:MAG: helix-turn-helix transcriptional regulator [Cyclobacteriaceae bacterium]
MGANIKAIRKLKNLSQEELATKIGVQKQHISGWENNKYQPSKDNLDKLALALGIKPIDVYNYSAEKHTIVSEPSFKYEAAVTDIEEVKVPLVEYRAYAGYLRGYADQEYMESLPTITVEREMVRGGHYVCFTLMGDSMDDGTWRALLDRDKVLGKELQRHHWQNKIHLNSYPFIIVHKSEGIVCKDITAHDIEKGIITVHSRNPIYDDYQMNLNDVLQIFFVVQLVGRGMKS